MRRYYREIDARKWLPPVTRDSFDCKEAVRIHSIELQLLWEILLDIFDNQFISSMTDYGLTQWENILDITPQSRSLDDRRQEILRTLYGLRPYTLESFQNMLNAAFGDGEVQLELKNNEYELWFNLSPSAIYRLQEIYSFSEPIVPKNLLIFFKNVKELRGTIYMGGVITSKVFTHIGADTGIHVPTMDGHEHMGGIVQFRKETII